MTINHTIYRDSAVGDGVEIPLTVELDYTPPSRGYRNSIGIAEEPDYDAEFEIVTATDAAGNQVELTKQEEDAIIQRASTEILSDY